MPSYLDYWYQSSDGLKLYARDYPAKTDTAPTILCMHGLTRNSADFEGISEVLAGDYRLLVVDQRGRGRSQYDTATANYQPSIYVQDMFRLLEGLAIDRLILMGTSMGGIMAMLMAVLQPTMVQALIVNDIGPEVNAAGLERLKHYVGKTAAVESWEEAAQQSKEINGLAFPNADADFWPQFARRTYRQNQYGKPQLAYDCAIAEPLNDTESNSAAPDLWPVFEQITAIPMLLIRGALSDILAPQCVQQMRELKPDLKFAQVPNVGHAPMLDESAAIDAITQFLADVS